MLTQTCFTSTQDGDECHDTEHLRHHQLRPTYQECKTLDTVPISMSQSSEPNPLIDILVQHRNVTITKQTIQKNMAIAKSVRHWPSNVSEAILC